MRTRLLAAAVRGLVPVALALLMAAAPPAQAATAITVVDSAGNVGEFSSLALNGSNPVVSYFASAANGVKLATCTANCATATPTWVLTAVDSASSVGQYTSLALDGGNPVVSYSDAANGNLKLATCTANCATATPTWVIITVDGIGTNVGTHSSLALNGGKPVVSYYSRGTGDLKLATCTDFCDTASPTWVITTVDSAGDVGIYTSLALDGGGNPVVSYYDSTNGNLKLATCTADCATATPTWVIATVDSAGDVGFYTSLALNGGEPVVSYYDATNSDLKLATCTANCATATPTWVITTVDSDLVGTYTSLALNGGNPVVSYQDRASFDLKLATCTANCATATPTWVLTTVDSAGDVGFHTSLALDAGGNAVVSHFDFLNGDLKLATQVSALVTGTKTAAGSFTVGSTVTYTVVLTNSGNGSMADNPGNEFVDVLPAGLALVSASASSGTTVATVATNTVTWNGAIASGGTVTITMQATINAAPAGTTIANQGTINYDADLDGSNESSITTDDPSQAGANDPTAFVVVGPLLTATKTASGSFVVGSTVTYTIIVTNSGNAAANDNAGNELTDVLPSSLALVSASATSGTAVSTIATNTVTWNGSIPAGGSVTLTINATILPAAAGLPVSNQATVAYDADVNGTNETTVLTDDPATGTAGDPTTFNAIAPPGAPTAVVASAGNAQATVTFTAPASNGGSAITGYTVTSIPPGGVDSNAGTTGTSHVITGLSNGVAYTFTVTATNAAGTGPASAPSNSVTPVSVPGAPTSVVAVAGNAQATVTFSAPASNGGSPITGYTVTSIPPGGVDTNAGTTGTSHLITGLINGTAYTFTVAATNAAGTGPASTPSNSVTPVTVPGAPTGVTASAGNTQATVTFTAPASNGGSAITGYTVTSNPAGGVDSNAGTTGTSHLITGLTNGVAYTFTVTATNAAGTGPASAASNGVTPTTVPGAPTGVTATAGNAQATVTFTAPASTGGSPISGYTVTSSPGGITATGASSPIVVTGLTNGTTYTFTVTATNATGTGLASAPSNSVTPLTVPAAPTGVTATAGNAQATVTFTAPATGGSAITGYTVTSSPSGITATGTASPITVTGLINGTAYTFTVIATNAQGAGPASAPSNSVTPSLNTFTGPTATGSGTASVTFTGGGPGCTFAPQGNGPMQSAFFIPVAGHPKSPPSGSAPSVVFRHGLLDFVLIGCTPGSTMTFTVTYPQALEAGTTYHKYGPTPGNATAHWYVLPATIAGSTATFSITDGALGDDDLTANGTVVDQGGPGAPGGELRQVPTLSEWALMLMAALMMLGAMRQKRRARLQ